MYQVVVDPATFDIDHGGGTAGLAEPGENAVGTDMRPIAVRIREESRV